jgi:branched-chain amino acid transport system ATP-binding protein
MLEVKDLHAYYGKSHILHGVHLNVRQGEIVSLLGRNGVGRSTTIKAIMGQVHATGSVKFKGEDLMGLKAYRSRARAWATCRRTATSSRPLTVRQNLLLGQKRPQANPRWSDGGHVQPFPASARARRTPRPA